MNRQLAILRIHERVEMERLRQIAIGFSENHDDELLASEWISVLTRQIGLGAPQDSKQPHVPDDLWERQMIRTMAVAQSALEAFYREHPERLEKTLDVRERGDEGRKNGS